eukprot:14928-Heterococcus_DN1.PRE.3
MSRLQFRSAEYWDLTAELTTAADDINSSSSRAFIARLAAVDSVPVATAKDFDAATGELLATSKYDSVLRSVPPRVVYLHYECNIIASTAATIVASVSHCYCCCTVGTTATAAATNSCSHTSELEIAVGGALFAQSSKSSSAPVPHRLAVVILARKYVAMLAHARAHVHADSACARLQPWTDRMYYCTALHCHTCCS